MLLKTGTTTAGNSGSYTVTTGAAVGGAGGTISMTVGTGNSGNGGDLSLTAGATSASGGTGGDVYIRGGAASAVGGSTGGDVNLISGASNAGNGKIKLEAGTHSFTLESSGDASLTTTLGVTGETTLHDDLLLAADNAVIKHTSTNAGGLTISSDTSYVDVELVRFTDNKLGINGDPDIVTLADQQVTIAGKLFVDSDFKVATSKFTVNANGDVNVNSGMLTVSATNGDTAVAGTLSAGATTVDSATVTGAASFGGEFSTAYAAVSATGGTATCTDAKSVCVVTGAGGASDGGWTVTYGGGSPATGTMVFVRNGSGVDTASTAFGTGTQILKNTGALFVYSGSAWTRII
jgi:hypothetical protein